ncbi:MAG: methyl-accepting chemotaxis protein [Dethiosulfovibrio sp.]|nr:methyl-accepting chemotaxis protein [Dethiosulfovibrio sp.]
MRLKLRGKILAWILCGLLIVQGGIAAYVGLTVRVNAVEQAEKDIQIVAEKYSLEITREMERFTTAISAFGASVEGIAASRSGDRENVLTMAHHLLERSPGALAVWFVFEPNEFDGKDIQFAGIDGFQDTGRFEGTFVRDGGSIVRTYDTTEESLKDGQWYYGALRSGRPIVAEPCQYSYSGEEGSSFFMTGISVPIKVDGRVMGVVGIDLDLDVFAKRVEAVSVTENSYNTLFSNEGYFLYHPNEKMMEKTLEEIGRGKIQDLDRILNVISSGIEEVTFDYALDLGEKAFKVHVPVSLGDGLPPWSLAVTVPMSDVTKEADVLFRNVILASVLGLLLMAVAVFLITGRIVKPVVGLSEILDRFSQLDFRSDASRSWLYKYRNDEIAEMIQSLRTMQSKVSDFVRSIQSESGLITGTSQSLAALAQETVASIEEVKASLDHVGNLAEANSAALEETTAGVQEVSAGASGAADSAAEGSEASMEMSRISQEAVSHVRSMVDMIRAVGDRSSNTMESMVQVEESVEAITSFVATITSIADQTNLLALNAAIEAARAGEHGRGFAVVAEEVRKLAEESNGAARNVVDLIGALQENASSSTASMKEVDQVVERIVDASDAAISNLDEALNHISRVEGAMQNIAALAEEQAAASQEMASGIDQATKGTIETAEILVSVKKGSEDTATASEQVAQEAQGLASGAERLNAIVETFSLDELGDRPLTLIQKRS